MFCQRGPERKEIAEKAVSLPIFGNKPTAAALAKRAGTLSKERSS